jgi:histidyl-tRNA synthetase
MSLSTNPYKGARDFYPEDKRVQKYMFNKLRQVVESFGYQEYDAPILEPLEIYTAKSGEEIVNEQLYFFEDKGGRKVAIRPEMTPSVSRMVAARRQKMTYPLRLYSLPNLWRYERPQRGRLREHWQLNVDLFGVESIEADHEIIFVADKILKSYGAATDSYTIRISSRKLVEFFLHDHLQLKGPQSLDAQKLIDRKHKTPRPEFEQQAKELLGSPDKAADLMEFIHTKDLDSLPNFLKQHPSVSQLQRLMDLLKASGVDTAVFDASVVRGMEYYTDIVFEVYDADPENMRSMFGGGRYDALVGLFGVDPLPTVGFGMGDVTLENFLRAHSLLPEIKSDIDAVAILIGEVYENAQPVLEKLRSKGVKIAVDTSDRKLDTKIKHTVKSGIRYIIFIGEQELADNKYKLKDLEKSHESVLGPDQLADCLAARQTDKNLI